MNDFDNNMKKQAGAFDMEPRGQVWDRITQELDGKKRNRRFAWLWWLVPLVVAGGGYAIYQTSANPDATLAQKQATSIEQHIQTPVTGETTVEKVPGRNPDLTDEGSIALNDAGKATTEFQHPQQNNSVFIPPTTDPIKAAETIQETVSVKKTTPNPFVATPKPAKTENKTENIAFVDSKNETIKAIKSNDNNQNQSKATAAIIPQSKVPKAEQLLTESEMVQQNKSIIPVDSLSVVEQTLAAKEIDKTIPEKAEILILTKDATKLALASTITSDSLTSSGVTTLPLSPTQKEAKAVWQIVGGIGLHNHSGKGIGLQSTLADYNSPLQNSVGGGFSGTGIALKPTKPGIGFMVGAERTMPIGKKWSWLAGLHYQYQTFKISTGARIDSGISLRENTSGVEKSAAYYYRPGSTISHTGKQHRMHLLTGIQLHIGKKQNWSWQNGLFGGVVLANDYLIPRGRTTGWVPSKNLSSTGYFGMETGLKFQPGQWGAGLFGQYNLSSSVNITSLPAQHWRSLELRIHYKISSPPSKK